MDGGAQNHLIDAVAGAIGRAVVAPDALVLVAVSGGPDSVALLHALIELRARFGFRIAAAHLNHRLRGVESDRDEAFVRELCAHLGVSLVVERVAGLDLAMANLEEAAREVRHDFLRRTAARLGASHIALGHHRGDQAETVVMRMLRGTGIAGLGAMDESGRSLIIRPLLSLGREEILRYLNAIGARFVEDSSNSSTAILRNKIRHRLMPVLESDFGPGVERHLAELATEMRTVDAFLTHEAAERLSALRLEGGGIDLAAFARLDAALRPRVLRAFIAERIGGLRGIERAHLDAIGELACAGSPSGEITLPGGWRAERDYSRLSLTRTRPEKVEPYAVEIALEGMTAVKPAGYVFEASVTSVRALKMPLRNDIALFDLREVTRTGLIARNFAPGDRVKPFGMGGTRKVKKVLIDSGVARRTRARIPIVTAGEGGEIVWIPGVVRGTRALVTAHSESILRIFACGNASN